MKCTNCNNAPAHFRVTEVKSFVAFGSADNEVLEQHVCEVCAQAMKLPHLGVQPKITKIWKLLQIGTKSAQAAVHAKTPSCPDCGMTLEELRRRGRVGCEKDYEIFAEYMSELLERMHGSHEHVGRLPGIGEDELERLQRVSDLKDRLELAIRDENYEDAASLRDEIKNLETQGS